MFNYNSMYKTLSNIFVNFLKLVFFEDYDILDLVICSVWELYIKMDHMFLHPSRYHPLLLKYNPKPQMSDCLRTLKKS